MQKDAKTADKPHQECRVVGNPRSPQEHSRCQPEHLFNAWADVAKRVGRAKAIVLFLDFDGTLVRLRPNPKDVTLGERARRLLGLLAAHPRVTLCFISGRQLRDLQQRVRVKGAIYFGLHGWERSDARALLLPAADKLRKSLDWVREQVRELPGIRVEDKGICFGVHYRTAADSDVREAKLVVDKALARLGSGFRMMAGKKIWEIYPNQMGNKGKAAQALLRQIPGRKLAIYAGDDTTDETAFAALKSGVTIRVGKFQETRAKYFLRDPAEVMTFLKKVEEILP